MFNKSLVAVALLLGLATPTFAQTGSMQPGGMQADRDTTMHSSRDMRDRSGEPTHAARDHREMSADRLNGRVARQVQMRDYARAEDRRDRREYRAALMRRHRMSVSRYQYRYARREAAYARAMAAWRAQVSECHHGNHRACRARSPRVANFY